MKSAQDFQHWKHCQCVPAMRRELDRQNGEALRIIDEVKAAVRRVRDVHHPVGHTMYGEACAQPGCGAVWPCRTIRALDSFDVADPDCTHPYCRNNPRSGDHGSDDILHDHGDRCRP